jgi:5'-3' exonuclease
MGIPSYFHSIIRSRGKHLFISSKSVKIGRLFLDLNCCIHGCKQRVVKWWKEHRDGKDITLENQEEFESRIIEEVIQTIQRFVEESGNPQQVWIMVDGVVPVAKMKQQRMRRFKAVEIQEQIRKIHLQADIHSGKTWDSNAITPGTFFMKHLCDSIRERFLSSSSSSSSVFFGGNLVENPGEGEQKIFEWIRKHPFPETSTSGETYDMIYGLDADLIMLSLLHRHLRKIILLREEQQFGKLIQTPSGEDSLVWFDVHSFGKELLIEWNGIVDKPKTESESGIQSGIQDYIFLCFLLGNDFVPHTPSIHFHQDGLERLLEAYRHVKKPILSLETDRFYRQIQWDTLKEILEYLSTHEEYIIQEDSKKINMIRTRVIRGEAPYMSIAQEYFEKPQWEYEIAKLDWKHLEYPDTICPEKNDWKSRYYNHMVGIGGDSTETKKKMSWRYFESLEWCWRYYHGLTVSMYDYYEFADAPLLEDLVKHLSSFIIHHNKTSGTLIEETEVEFPSAESQLIAVLPVESFHIFPNPKMLKVAELIPEFYPSGYMRWSFLKTHEWMCQSILPVIDIERIEYLLSIV